METSSGVLKEIALQCLQEKPSQRPTFSDILQKLNNVDNEPNWELVAQRNLIEKVERLPLDFSKTDSLSRDLFFQCCIFQNMEMLELITKKWGHLKLKQEDMYGLTLTHLCARNGFLKGLEFLDTHGALSHQKELRFGVFPLNFAMAMKHDDCTKFLISRASKDELNQSLLNCAQEGNLFWVQKLIEQGADLEARQPDTGASPLDRGKFKELIKF